MRRSESRLRDALAAEVAFELCQGHKKEAGEALVKLESVLTRAARRTTAPAANPRRYRLAARDIVARILPDVYRNATRYGCKCAFKKSIERFQ